MAAISLFFLSSPSPSLYFPSKPRSQKISCRLSIKQQGSDQATRPADPSTAEDSVDSIRAIFAAGGTGGRIYPAVAIADELKLIKPNSKFLFVGCPDSMESVAVSSVGFNFISISSVRFAGSFPENLFFPYRLIKSILKSYRILQEFEPSVVVGTGGYVSFPICLAAVLKRIRLVIQEQNVVPGTANWLLSFFADVVFVAYNSTIECFPRNSNCIVCGNPVRLSLRGLVSKAMAQLHLFPRLEEMGGSEEVKVVLVLEGSFGANAINIAMLNLYYQMLLEHKNWFIIWQTGVESYNEMESLVRNHQQLILTPFLHRMDLAYAAADLIVSRAGAMTCSEILATGKPAILIPSPNVSEGHQMRNASLMADVAGSVLITEDELDSITLRNAIEALLGDKILMREMSERALKAAKPEAAAEIAKHILSLVNSPVAKK